MNFAKEIRVLRKICKRNFKRIDVKQINWVKCFQLFRFNYFTFSISFLSMHRKSIRSKTKTWNQCMSFYKIDWLYSIVMFKFSFNFEISIDVISKKISLIEFDEILFLRISCFSSRIFRFRVSSRSRRRISVYTF